MKQIVGLFLMGMMLSGCVALYSTGLKVGAAMGARVEGTLEERHFIRRTIWEINRERAQALRSAAAAFDKENKPEEADKARVKAARLLQENMPSFTEVILEVRGARKLLTGGD